MINNDFIDKISFNEDFLPFKNGDKIEFGGKKEVQDLIKFYLKDKKILDSKGIEISAEENADRFKINCILGNNGGGKSRLFEGILKNDENIEINNIEGKEFILDDLFVFSNNSNNSVHKYLLPGFKGNSNNFIYHIYNLLVNNKTFLKGFLGKKYLNYEILAEYYASYNIGKGLLKVNDNEFTKKLKNKNKTILKNNFYHIISNLGKKNKSNVNSIVLFNIKSKSVIRVILDFLLVLYLKYPSDNYPNIFSKKSILFKFCNGKGNNFLKKIFIIFFEDVFNKVGLLGKEIDTFIDSGKYGIKKNGDFDFNDLLLYKDKIILLYDKMFGKEHDNLLVFFEKLEKKEFSKIKDFGNKILNEIKNINLGEITVDDLIFEGDIFPEKKYKITEQEKIILENIFSIGDISFGGINFSSFSAGEKLVFIRFTNIYMKILDEYESKKEERKYRKKSIKEAKDRGNILEFAGKIGKDDFVVLIDEPDLHLHLDWQKKYIQKLIDVFSTLDKNIKLHFIIATHSPFIISDLPSESIIVLDGKGSDSNKTEYTKISKYKEGKKTFGANFVDIINDGFFFKDKVLMGSFAESIIGNLSSVYKTKILLESYNIEKNNFDENKDLINALLKKSEIIKEDISNFDEYSEKIKFFDKLDEIKNNIGDDFLKENLLYL